MVVELLADRFGFRFSLQRYRSRLGEGRIGGVDVTLMKPQTFMNLSGEAVGHAVRSLLDGPGELLVVSDDANLGFGDMRLRRTGGHGGHNGLRSVIACVGTEEFSRLRIGVGCDRLPDDLTDYVLAEFDRDERDQLPEIVDRASRAAETVLTEGIDEAMNRFN
jgi:PTH1 family peptidyl-tRNA hydrolase